MTFLELYIRHGIGVSIKDDHFSGDTEMLFEKTNRFFRRTISKRDLFRASESDISKFENSVCREAIEAIDPIDKEKRDLDFRGIIQRFNLTIESFTNPMYDSMSYLFKDSKSSYGYRRDVTEKELRECTKEELENTISKEVWKIFERLENQKADRLRMNGLGVMRNE